jgi:DNA-binding CsgD family transcriptional regulator
VGPFPVAIVDLRSFLLVALSERGATFLGMRHDEPAHLDVLALTEEPEQTRTALTLMASGGIDAYEGRQRLRGPDGATLAVHVWVRHLGGHGHPDLALIFLEPHDPSNPVDSFDRPTRARERFEVVARESAHAEPTSVTIRVTRPGGDWDDVLMTVGPEGWEPATRAGVSSAADRNQLRSVPGHDAGSEVRVARLEETLLRIASEIHALGVASPTDVRASPSLPEPPGLSKRQSEIVARLVRGERVPSIARSMFLSQSTVRNHLSAVYAKFQVHSQQELIERLRRAADTPANDS